MFWFCFVLMWNEGPSLTSRSESGVFSSMVERGGGPQVCGLLLHICDLRAAVSLPVGSTAAFSPPNS